MKEITEFKFISLDLISYDSDINESKDEVNEFIEVVMRSYDGPKSIGQYIP